MPKNTITKDQIDALLAASTFTDAKLGVKTTVVCCRLPNGFEITETSGCVDPANYNHELGVATCKRRLVDRVWQLEGYRLQCVLADPVDSVWKSHELNEERVGRVAAALLNARGNRRGAPGIANVLDLVPQPILSDALDDARAALKALQDR